MSAKASKAAKAAGRASAASPAAPLCLRFFPVCDEPAWRWLPHMLGLAFILRAIVALAGDFVIHPDEIFQHLEPAHEAVFGSGVLYWEFFYGARNWLVPGTIAAILWLCDLVGLGEPRFYIPAVKLFFCAVSLLIPWGAYQYSRSLFGERCGRLALALACIWPLLVGYGHKPFTEFVATHLIFAFLGLATLPLSRRPAGVVLAALAVTLAAFVRFQLAPVAAMAWLLFLLGRDRRHALAALAASLLVAGAVALLETVTWGWPYKSYILNFLFNYHKGGYEQFTSNFYLPRLLYATAGLLVLPAVALALAFRSRWRGCLLALAMMLVVLASHMIQPHKEMRFVFLLIPLTLLVAAMLLDSLPDRIGGWARRAAIAGGAAFSAAMLGNLLPGIVWYHHGNSFERGEVNFIRGHSPLWSIYRGLAGRENVTGVLHLGDPFFNTPGYFHLHRDVPFYDESLIQRTVQQHMPAFRQQGRVPELDFFVSHVVAKQGTPDLPGFEVIADHGGYRLLESRRAGKPTIGWESRDVYITGGPSGADTYLVHKSIGEVPGPEPIRLDFRALRR